MNIRKTKLILYVLFMACTFFYLNPLRAHAAARAITVDNNFPTTANIYAGDTGTISPNLSYIGDQSALQYYSYNYECDNTEILSIDSTGQFTALSPGTVNVTVKVYSGEYYYYNTVFTSSVQFIIGVDMTNVTLSTDNVCAYMTPTYYNRSKPYYSYPETQITINSSYVIDQPDSTNFNFSCTNTLLGIEASIYDNILTIRQYNTTEGTGLITFNIYGKQFNVIYQSTKLGISKQSSLLVKGKKEKLTISGYTGEIIWSSSNPTIATVDSNGVVKGKKIGNVIVKAKVGDQYLGCAVSVTKSKLKKVCERATYIGTHWKYSQAKRTQKGYYDCSALVWKAYKEKAGVTFGSKWYPGVALSEAQWCRSHNKMITGGIKYSKIRKMQVNPGDLLFKSSNMKKKYADIYHVEMFTGYFCNYVSPDGTASFSPLWAARDSSYYFEEGSLLGRPMK